MHAIKTRIHATRIKPWYALVSTSDYERMEASVKEEKEFVFKVIRRPVSQK